MHNVKNDTNELIYKTETDSETQKTNLWLPKGKGWGQTRSMELTDVHCYKIDKQKGFTVQHRELYSVSYNL